MRTKRKVCALPSATERKRIYEKKAGQAARDISLAIDKKQAIRTFLKYLRWSI